MPVSDSERPRRRGLALAGLLLALAGCERAGGGDSAPVRVRLTELVGELRALAPTPAQSILREDFERVPADWHVVTELQAPLAGDPSLLTTSAAREGERAFVTLSGPRGALYRIVPVEPDTPYLFEGELRARELAPAVEGARFWLAELSADGSPAELFAPGRDPFVRRHPLAPAAGTQGWQTRRAFFRTAAATRALVVMCQLWIPNPAKGESDLQGGAVDFEHLALARIGEHELWELEAARAVAAAYRGDALPAREDARARRRVDAMLGAEQRPALLCLPGESLRFALTVPRAEPRFEAGFAPWPAGFRPAQAATGWLRVDGQELWRGELPAANALGECGWQELALELAPFAGRRVTLELGAEGALPVVFGAPLVRSCAPASLPWNVLLVSIDTLRSDRVGAYGATSGATPRLDQLARQALVFEDMSANAPYTLPAHASLFSGQYPSVHAVEDEGVPLAPARSPILARILAERGWRTQAFTAAGFLTPDFGFHAGFDGFSLRDPLRHPGSKFFRDFAAIYPEQGPAPAEPGGARVRRWIRAHQSEPFFLFVHTYEVHDYDPPPGTLDCAAKGCRSTLTDFSPLTLKDKNRAPFPGSSEDRAHLGHLYDAALRHVDGEVGALLDELEQSGIAGRTLVVITSDHGEELFERGFLQHGKSLQREVLAIPLLVRVPGRAAQRVTTPAMQVDVAPTILAALGLPRDARMQGRDLLAAPGPPRPIWAEVDDARARQQSLRDGRWKLVYGSPDAAVRFPSAREWSLYDLTRDPGELRDLSASAGAELARLRRQLEAFRAELRAESEALGPPPSSELDESTQALLQQLGYGG